MRVAAIVEGCGELFGKPEDLIDLSNGEKSGIAGEGVGRNLEFDRTRGQKIEGKQRSRV
jgi:hypothetical protein